MKGPQNAITRARREFGNKACEGDTAGPVILDGGRDRPGCIQPPRRPRLYRLGGKRRVCYEEPAALTPTSAACTRPVLHLAVDARQTTPRTAIKRHGVERQPRPTGAQPTGAEPPQLRARRPTSGIRTAGETGPGAPEVRPAKKGCSGGTWCGPRRKPNTGQVGDSAGGRPPGQADHTATTRSASRPLGPPDRWTSNGRPRQRGTTCCVSHARNGHAAGEPPT